MKKIIFIFSLLFVLEFSLGQIKQKSLIASYFKEINFNYAVHLPDNYEIKKQDWPRINFLNGAGVRGNDLKKIGVKPMFTKYPKGKHNIWDRVYSNPKFYKRLLNKKLNNEN